MAALQTANRPSVQSSIQAQPDATASSSGSAYQTVMPAVETADSADSGYDDVLKTTSRGDTKERSMNYAILNAAPKATTLPFKPASYAPVPKNISLSTLARAAGTIPVSRAGSLSVPGLIDTRSVALNPAFAPVAVDTAPPVPAAPPVVVVEEEPWYKSPAVMGIGILLLVAGGYALYKSQGT